MEVRVISRASAPTDTKHWLEDRRRLGVYVERIQLRGSYEVRMIPLDHPDLLEGWWAVERAGQGMRRWTQGNALLPLPVCEDPPMTLEIRADTAGLIYIIEGKNRPTA